MMCQFVGQVGVVGGFVDVVFVGGDYDDFS